MTKVRCAGNQHDWQPVRGGKRERCSRCGDVFPCRHDCTHYDCKLEKGVALPDHVTVS